MNSSTNQSKTLWIGDVENWMDEKFLYQTFSEYAPVRGVKIIKDRNTGMALGYGFVEFESNEIAQNILNNLQGKTIPNTNKMFKLNWATFGANKNVVSGMSVNSNSNFGYGNNYNSSNNNGLCPEYSIYVGDLDTSVNESLLKDFFQKFYDSVISAKLILSQKQAEDMDLLNFGTVIKPIKLWLK